MDDDATVNWNKAVTVATAVTAHRQQSQVTPLQFIIPSACDEFLICRKSHVALSHGAHLCW